MVDNICVTLMVTGGIGSLSVRPASAAGLLATAWAFALGFAWRSVFGRIELLDAGKQSVNGEAAFVLTILIVALIVILIILAWALWLTWCQIRAARNLAKSVKLE